MVRHISIFNILISKKFIMRTLLHEILTVEIINKKFTIETKILWQQHELLCKKKDFDIL